MRLVLILILGAWIPVLGYCQTPDSLATATLINQQVWQPFRTTWSSRNPTGFNALHTEGVLRIGRRIMIGEEYRETNEANFPSFDAPPREIDFTFESRVFRESVAYETGYYRITVHPKRTDPRYYYGYFHVRLEKVGDAWKIAQDWDTNAIAGEPIGVGHFESGVPLVSE